MVDDSLNHEMIKLGKRLRLIRKSLGFSAKEIGEKLGINGTSVTRWETGNTEPPLSYLFFLLNEFKCNISWLITGIDENDLPPALTVRNTQGCYTGDLLNVVLGFIHLSNEDVCIRTGIDKQDLNNLLDSRRKPNFDELEAFYLNLGINPAYFFDGNEHHMWWPHDQLDRVFMAVNLYGRQPNEALVAEIFEISYEEATDFLNKRAKMAKEGHSLSLPDNWLNTLCERYTFNPGWLDTWKPPILIKRVSNSRTNGDIESIADVELLQKIAVMSERLEKKDKAIDELTAENKRLAAELEVFKSYKNSSLPGGEKVSEAGANPLTYGPECVQTASIAVSGPPQKMK